jgi:uncharacterized cupin superfamily protein
MRWIGDLGMACGGFSRRMLGSAQAQLSFRLRTRHDAAMPKIDLGRIPERNSTGYPPPFDRAVAGRWQRRLAAAAGLAELGVSLVRLEPGAWSSQRHWHEGEDEFLVMLSGEGVLIDDQGEHLLLPGDCAAFPKGERNGHHVVNRSKADCTFVCMSATGCRRGLFGHRHALHARRLRPQGWNTLSGRADQVSRNPGR